MKKYTLAIMISVACMSASAQWKYDTKKSAMTDAMDTSANLKSENKFAFGFPYQGGTSEWIKVRRHDGLIDVAIVINKGQIVHNGGVTIRFDDDEAMEFQLDEPGDGDSAWAFIHFHGYLKGCTTDCHVSQDDFMRRLQTSRRMRVQATYYQEGQKVYEFKTGGLSFPG